MCRRRSIAEQYNVVVAPALAQDAVEVEPGRAAQMARVRHQFVASKIAGKDSLAGLYRLFGAHPFEAGSAPGRLRAFNNERRAVGVKLVGVRPDPAVFGFLEDKGKGVVELLVRP